MGLPAQFSRDPTDYVGNCPHCGVLLRVRPQAETCHQCGALLYPKGSVTLEGDEDHVSLGISIEIDLGELFEVEEEGDEDT